MDQQLKNRLYQLPPNFRFRIESYIDYHPDFNPVLETDLSEQALLITNALKDESKVFFFTTYSIDNKYKMLREVGIELHPNHTKETLNYVGELALAYMRNPTSIEKMPPFEEWIKQQKDEGDET